MTDPPLCKVRVVEFAGLGPATFCGMMLADLGAEVIRVERPYDSEHRVSPSPILDRGRRSIRLDLKTEAGLIVARRLIASSDVLLEGFRPGVAERLGIGPAVAHELNNALVYCRMTGWGQDGPLAHKAGHDINYIAVAGLLGSIGEGVPSVPLNIVGDYAGGGALAAFGVLASLMAVRDGARMQVVDSAMTDGVLYLLSLQYEMLSNGEWVTQRASNKFDGGHPLYSAYRCADDKFVAIGAVEDVFAVALLEKLGAKESLRLDWNAPENSDNVRRELSSILAKRTRDQWIAELEDVDGCVSPVLDLGETKRHPHVQARQMFRQRDDVIEPTPAPRFTFAAARTTPSPTLGEHTEEILKSLGYGAKEIEELLSSGAAILPSNTAL